MEGLKRVQVSLVLTVAAAATGFASGLVVGAAWAAAGLGQLGGVAALALLVVALAGDLAHVTTGRLRPLSVQRQVPRIWGRIFDLRTAALLYGARLGVGPLTILRTWLWWVAAIIGASQGAFTSAAVGATFGATRMLTILLASHRVRPAMADRMARLRARERALVPFVGATGVVGSALILGLV